MVKFSKKSSSRNNPGDNKTNEFSREKSNKYGRETETTSQTPPYLSPKDSALKKGKEIEMKKEKNTRHNSNNKFEKSNPATQYSEYDTLAKGKANQSNLNPNPHQSIGSGDPVEEEKIRAKAYEIYEKRGYSNGNDWQDWFEAQQVVRKA